MCFELDCNTWPPILTCRYWPTNTDPPILTLQYWPTNTHHQYWPTNTDPPILTCQAEKNEKSRPTNTDPRYWPTKYPPNTKYLPGREEREEHTHQGTSKPLSSPSKYELCHSCLRICSFRKWVKVSKEDWMSFYLGKEELNQKCL